MTGAPRGMTATAMTALSADPPSLIVCIDRATRTHEEVMHVRTFADRHAGREPAAHQPALLATGCRQAPRRCGGSPRRSRPVIRPASTGAMAHLVCTIDSALDAYTHTVVVGPRPGDLAEPAEPGAVAVPRRRATPGWRRSPAPTSRRSRRSSCRIRPRTGSNSPFRRASAREHRAQTELLRSPDDRVREHDIREADAEVGDHDATRSADGSCPRGSPRRSWRVGSG